MKVTRGMTNVFIHALYAQDDPGSDEAVRVALEAALADEPEPRPSPSAAAWRARAVSAEAKLAKVCEWAWQTGSGVMNWTKLYQILDDD